MQKRLRLKANENKNKIEFFADSAKDFFDGSHIEIIGDEEINIDSCLAVLGFDEDFIRLSLKNFNLSIYGEKLFVSSFEEKCVTIKGKIRSLEFL